MYNLFLEQEVDGETLISLSSSGSIEQFSHCGLCTIKDQFKLKRLVEASAANQVTSDTCTPVVTSIGCTHAVKLKNKVW